MGKVVWLASYPRSGNTWARAFLSAYRQNALDSWAQVESWHVASRSAFYESIGVESTDLPASEVQNLRPSVFREVAAAADRAVIAKVHDAWGLTPDGSELFPRDITAVAIYLVRNPLDVVVSWAHHDKVDFDSAIDFLCDANATVSPLTEGGPGRQLPQALDTWSHHVTRWVDQRSLPVHVVRYEDLLAEPHAAFARLLAATGESVEERRLDDAVTSTSFERLRALEATPQFAERPLGVERFFRRGVSGGWRDALSEAQVERVVRAHAPTMRRFGYLSDAGRHDGRS